VNKSQKTAASKSLSLINEQTLEKSKEIYKKTVTSKKMYNNVVD
jgi:hypothetical protein